MFDILYWAFITVIGVGTGWLIAGTNGVVFLSLVCAVGGLMLIVESKLHPRSNQ